MDILGNRYRIDNAPPFAPHMHRSRNDIHHHTHPFALVLHSCIVSDI